MHFLHELRDHNCLAFSNNISCNYNVFKKQSWRSKYAGLSAQQRILRKFCRMSYKGMCRELNWLVEYSTIVLARCVFCFSQ